MTGAQQEHHIVWVLPPKYKRHSSLDVECPSGDKPRSEEADLDSTHLVISLNQSGHARASPEPHSGMKINTQALDNPTCQGQPTLLQESHRVPHSSLLLPHYKSHHSLPHNWFLLQLLSGIPRFKTGVCHLVSTLAFRRHINNAKLASQVELGSLAAFSALI